MLKYLDVSMEGGGKMHVHHLQHSDAEEVANTLQSLISGRGGGGGKARSGGARRARRRRAPAGSADVFEGAVAVTAQQGHERDRDHLVGARLRGAAADHRPARFARASRCSSKP